MISELNAELAPLVLGYRTRIVDGNALGATEHRLDVLRETRSGPLLGKSLVVFDYERDITTEMLACEDGHAQERSLFRKLAALVRAGELWITDRNFCTKWLLKNIVARGAAFLIRQHGKLRVTSLSELAFKGNCEGGGTVFEQDVRIGFGDDAMVARRIVVFLGSKTRDGDGVLTLLTSLPPEAADAVRIADLYRKRWRIETMFKELTTTLRCEVKELGNPRAALLVFAVAILSANLHAAIRAALRVAHGNEVAAQISTYRIPVFLRHAGAENLDSHLSILHTPLTRDARRKLTIINLLPARVDFIELPRVTFRNAFRPFKRRNGRSSLSHTTIIAHAPTAPRSIGKVLLMPPP